MFETWYCMDCPRCGVKNWVNNGNTEDLTVPDVEGIRCHSCHHEWLLGEDFAGLTTLENAYIEDGIERP